MVEKIDNKIGKNQVIQYMVDKCRESSGTLNFIKRVKMLRNFVLLEIPELKSDILEKEKQLKLEAKLKVMKLFKENPDEYIHPAKRMMHDIDINEDSYEELDAFLNSIINEDN